jgi:SAM-dependent methyltransferase
MDIELLRSTWDAFGERDPMWAVLTDPAKKGGQWNREEFFATGRAQLEELRTELRTLGIPLAFRRALDVGCGIGRVSQALAAHYQEVEGVDIAPSMIQRAEAENEVGGSPRITYRVVHGTDLSHIPNGSIDLVWCYIVLQHMPPRFAFSYIREFMRVLSPEGVAVFQLPNRPATLRAWLRHWLQRLPPRLWQRLRTFRNGGQASLEMAMYAVSRRAVRRLVRNAGGRIIREAPHPMPSYPGTTYFVQTARSPGRA